MLPFRVSISDHSPFLNCGDWIRCTPVHFYKNQRKGKIFWMLMVTDWVFFGAQRIAGEKMCQIYTGYAKSSSGIKLYFQSFVVLTTVHLSDAQRLSIFCSFSILTKTPMRFFFLCLPLIKCLWNKQDQISFYIFLNGNFDMRNTAQLWFWCKEKIIFTCLEEYAITRTWENTKWINQHCVGPGGVFIAAWRLKLMKVCLHHG